MREVKIGLTPNGVVVGEADGDLYLGMSAAEALGKWCYHHRRELGIRFELRSERGSGFSPP